MPETQAHVTDEQIARIEVVIAELAKKKNAWGIGILKQLTEHGKDAAMRRRIILGSYGQMYEAMLSIQMALQSNRTPEQVKAALAAQGKR